MDVYEHLDQMKPFITNRNWGGLEREFADRCRGLAGEAQTERIAGVSLADYEIALEHGLWQAVARAGALDSRAIYFEYDLDNDWQGAFFCCANYQPGSAEDDDWACDFTDCLAGPDMPLLSEIYRENHFDSTPIALGSTLFLVARTVAAFGRASRGFGTPSLALCLAFHDQDPIMRINDVAQHRQAFRSEPRSS
jgi:hypothetical protein